MPQGFRGFLIQTILRLVVGNLTPVQHLSVAASKGRHNLKEKANRGLYCAFQ